jgi:hypothetical protein
MNCILLCVRLIFVLTFVVLANTLVLNVNNKGNQLFNFANNNINLGNTNKCLNKTFCNKNERCTNKTKCVCDHGWVTYGKTMRINDSCSYKQRSKTVAVLVSVYFGILGIDWFYLSRENSGYIMLGILKLLISCGCCSGWPLLVLGTYRLSGVKIISGYIISILFSLISFTWWITDWARILANKFPDGNGIELKHFSENS